MNLAVHNVEDRNAGHAHPLACGCPSAQLSGLRTGKGPTSRNTITLCNKVCDGEVTIRVCCAECCKVVLYCISAAQSPKRVMELDVGCEGRVRRRHISVVEHLLVVGPCRCLILENCQHLPPC